MIHLNKSTTWPNQFSLFLVFFFSLNPFISFVSLSHSHFFIVKSQKIIHITAPSSKKKKNKIKNGQQKHNNIEYDDSSLTDKRQWEPESDRWWNVNEQSCQLFKSYFFFIEIDAIKTWQESAAQCYWQATWILQWKLIQFNRPDQTIFFHHQCYWPEKNQHIEKKTLKIIFNLNFKLIINNLLFFFCCCVNNVFNAHTGIYCCCCCKIFNCYLIFQVKFRRQKMIGFICYLCMHVTTLSVWTWFYYFFFIHLFIAEQYSTSYVYFTLHSNFFQRSNEWMWHKNE